MDAQELLARRDALRQAPEPVEVRASTVVAIGTALWVVALLVLLPFAEQLQASGRGRWLPICAVGVLLGVIGLFVCHRRERRRR